MNRDWLRIWYDLTDKSRNPTLLTLILGVLIVGSGTMVYLDATTNWEERGLTMLGGIGILFLSVWGTRTLIKLFLRVRKQISYFVKAAKSRKEIKPYSYKIVRSGKRQR